MDNPGDDIPPIDQRIMDFLIGAATPEKKEKWLDLCASIR